MTDIDEPPKSQKDDEEDSYYADIGFLLEGAQPTKAVRFSWADIHVTLHVIDDEPGAVQSGHYLWPAAKLLTEYLIHQYPASPPTSMLELGAGTALASLAALQLWHNRLQTVLVTDHDPGCLERARGNYESTMEELLDECPDDNVINEKINTIASIPVCFLECEWGKEKDAEILRENLLEHVVPERKEVDLIIGTDLIYDVAVVEPLFTTAATMMQKPHGAFLLAQSFEYDQQTEEEIDQQCEIWNLQRTICLEDGARRIQQFQWRIQEVPQEQENNNETEETQPESTKQSIDEPSTETTIESGKQREEEEN